MIRAAVAGLACGIVLSTPVSAQTGEVDAGDARINYLSAGHGRAVVFIHGWALHLREWDDQIRALSPEFRVVAYDRRGFGRSTGFPDVSADPGDLALLLDTLGIRSAVLVGHSAGADVAYRFAAAFPERVDGLVLYGGPPPSGFPALPAGPLARDPRRAIAREHGVDSLMKFVTSLPQFQPGPNRTALMAARLDSIVRQYSGRDLLEDHAPSGRFPPAPLDAVRQLRMPILYMSGEREAPGWLQVTDSLVRWLPNARRVLVPGGGHGVHFDEPDRFNRALLAFLRELPGDKP